MTSRELRARARRDLSGRWLFTVVITLIAALLGGSVSFFADARVTTTNINFRDTAWNPFGPSYSGEGGIQINGEQATRLLIQLMPFIMGGTVLAIILGLIRFCIGAFISLGLIQYNLDLVDQKNPDFGVIFSKANYFANAFFLRLRGCIFIFLWSLLFLIPGIIKSFSYSMAGFIAAENPEISSKEAIDLSMDMMRGHKLSLFFLELSFIGWHILTILTLGIGNLWLNPYRNAARAEFYNMVSREYESERRA